MEFSGQLQIQGKIPTLQLYMEASGKEKNVIKSAEIREPENTAPLWIPKVLSETQTEESVQIEVEEYIADGKWEKLCRQYQKAPLLVNGPDYIRIAPKDMILLGKDYHKLANNSFLLHGYYNYKHLVLGPDSRKKDVYLLGVPGNFYAQEVNVARMFGFEYFENGKAQVRSGDFGYYMKKVEI